MPELIGEDRLPNSDFTAGARWKAKLLISMIALAGIGGVVMLVLYGYEKSRSSGASLVIPIISARDGPTKVRPAKPGGMEIHHQDINVYNRIDPTAKQSKVEKLLPAPDPIMAKPGSEKSKKTQEVNNLKPVLKKESFPKNSSLKRVSPKKTLVEKKNIKIGKGKLLPMTNGVLKGGYRVQFASLRKKNEAAALWKTLKGRYPTLFANLKPHIERAVIAGKGTYYRLQAGIFKNSVAARALCNKAKIKNIGCFIVKLP